MPLNPPGKICRHQADVVPGNVQAHGKPRPSHSRQRLGLSAPGGLKLSHFPDQAVLCQFLQGLQHGGQTDSQPGHNLQLGGSPLLADEPENPRFILSLSPRGIISQKRIPPQHFHTAFPGFRLLRRSALSLCAGRVRRSFFFFRSSGAQKFLRPCTLSFGKAAEPPAVKQAWIIFSLLPFLRKSKVSHGISPDSASK